MWIKNHNRSLSSNDIVELFGRSYWKLQMQLQRMAFVLQVYGHRNIFREIDYLAAQQDAVKECCTINATLTKLGYQSNKPFTNDARSFDNRLILTETSVTLKQDPEFDPELSNSKFAHSTLTMMSPYDINPVPDEKRNIFNREGRTKSKKGLIDSDDEEEIHFDTDSDPDAVIGQEAPDAADVECMFCNCLFSQDARGETWIKCFMCGFWAYGVRSGAEFGFVIFASNLNSFLKLWVLYVDFIVSAHFILSVNVCNRMLLYN